MPPSFTLETPIAFIGGGNMASAIIGGLLRQGLPAERIDVVEPFAEARAALHRQFGITALEKAGPQLDRARLVVWAIKPQNFQEAARQVAAHTPGALHLSVAAGIRTSSIAQWLGSERIVRAMPNTPALIGQGMTGLYARPAVSPAERSLVEQVIATTGAHLWVEEEALLDAVWGSDVYVEARTVDVHVGRLRKALNVEGTVNPIRTVRSAGYSLDPNS